MDSSTVVQLANILAAGFPELAIPVAVAVVTLADLEAIQDGGDQSGPTYGAMENPTSLCEVQWVELYAGLYG